MNTLLSIYDNSGKWPSPFLNDGWDVIQLDKQQGFDARQIDSAEFALEHFEDVSGIMSAPPCTDFTISGNRFWQQKDESGQTAASLELVDITLRLVDLFEPTDPDYDGNWFWAIENPVGRLKKLRPQLGDAFWFHPSDYAGYLDLTDADHNELDRLRRKDGRGIEMPEVHYILKCNAYTKKTGLWGCFNREIPQKPIEPVKGSPHGSPLLRFGGNRERTKNIRSATPLGFAKAFWLANKDVMWSDLDESILIE